jgi:hemerythrin-like domain-containing protein
MNVPSATRQIRDEHAAIAAVLNSLRTLATGAPTDPPAGFFDTLSEMLFYLDEFPERRHHRVESDVLFPTLARAVPELRGIIHRLELDHLAGEHRIRELQHELLAWRYVGGSRFARFNALLDEYVRFYLRHMATEEAELLPALARIEPKRQAELDAAFEAARDPLTGGASDAACARLLASITLHARNPVGLGAPRTQAGSATHPVSSASD